MMQIDQEKLRAFLDQSLTVDELAAVKKHLDASPQAQAALKKLRMEHYNVAAHLDTLSPLVGEYPDSLQAWQQLQARISGQSTLSNPVKTKERFRNMVNKSFIKQYQPAFAILAVVMIIAVALSFAPVRAMAGTMLKVFRVQSVKVVSVDKEDMETLRNNPNLKNLINKLEPQLEVISKETVQKVDSLEKAAELVGFNPATITALPENMGIPGITVYQQKVIQMQMEKELIEAVFDAAEIDVDLPESLNDEPIVLTQPNSVVQKWYHADKTMVQFSQMTPPAIEYPNDLDLDALGVASLQLLGMTQEEAEKLGGTIDWVNTMVLPISNNAKTNISEISINGDKGLLFVTPDSKSDEAAIMWTHNDMRYFINGQYPVDKVVEMAKSVQ